MIRARTAGLCKQNNSVKTSGTAVHSWLGCHPPMNVSRTLNVTDGKIDQHSVTREVPDQTSMQSTSKQLSTRSLDILIQSLFCATTCGNQQQGCSNCVTVHLLAHHISRCRCLLASEASVPACQVVCHQLFAACIAIAKCAPVAVLFS